MKILVTGSEGYIGSVLMPLLKEKGHEICGYDICFYKKGIILENILEDYPLIRKDIRDIKLSDVEGFDAIIHLAALSNDHLGALNESLTYDINYKASVKLASLAKEAGVKRFIFSSSCSLYGASDKILTEKDYANPQTSYGKSKILAENEISKLASKSFSPTYMRNATAFGISPRMRFDIVVNNLTGFAHIIKEIKILSDGKAWRPLVHVKDICNAMICVLEVDKKLIHNQAFNVGSNNENYQVKEIAKKIQNIYSDCKISINNTNETADTRNYNVCFDKLNKTLDFECSISLSKGVEEIYEIYNSIKLTENTFNDKYFTRLKQIKYLQKNLIIDDDLRTKRVLNEF